MVGLAVTMALLVIMLPRLPVVTSFWVLGGWLSLPVLAGVVVTLGLYGIDGWQRFERRG